MTLFDPGLQPERTELAWRRTALSLAAGALFSLRLLPMTFGSVLWILPGLLGLVGAGILWRGARRRYRDFGEATQGRHAPGRLPGGVLIAGTAAFVLVGAVAALALILRIALSR